MFCNFSLQLNMAKHRHFFLNALGPETEKQIKLAENKIRVDFKLSKGDGDSDARI